MAKEILTKSQYELIYAAANREWELRQKRAEEARPIIKQQSTAA